MIMIITIMIKGAYLQCDDGIHFDMNTLKLTHIRNVPMNPDKLYLTVVKYLTAFDGLDDITPLTEYVKGQQQLGNKLFFKDHDTAVEPKHLIVAHYSRMLLYDILKHDNHIKSTYDDHDKTSAVSLSISRLFIYPNSCY